MLCFFGKQAAATCLAVYTPLITKYHRTCKETKLKEPQNIKKKTIDALRSLYTWRK